MKKVGPLVETFLKNKRTIPSQNSDYVVVKRTNTQIPVLATNKWEFIDGNTAIKKTYSFRLHSQKADFVKELLDWENDLGHHAVFTIKELSVTLTVRTQGVGMVTEIDKEYADFADVLYKQVVYDPQRAAL